tara:strand:+ start:76 stop:516 length:441 start_codon:yes stop_codon:yes gene_type:complete
VVVLYLKTQDWVGVWLGMKRQVFVRNAYMKSERALATLKERKKMKTISEVAVVLKSLYTAPLGCFPRGGLESSLKLKVCTAPYFLTLTDVEGNNSTLNVDGEHYVVTQSIDGDSSISKHKDLQEALESLLFPFVAQEIKRKLKLII